AGNRGYGVSLEGSGVNRVGGIGPDGRNVISANGRQGVRLVGAASVDNSIRNNYVGTDPSGSLDRGNGGNGIEIGAFEVAQGYASRTVIGGTDPAARNVVSGNAFSGIVLIGEAVTGNVIRGNYVGTNAAGDAAVANDVHGILLTLPVNNFGVALAGSATGNTIGGAVPGAGNLVSGNRRHGIFLVGDASDNVVQGNFVGTDASGSADVGNAQEGILLRDAADIGVGGPADNLIGGDTGGAGNVVSGNGGNGITLSGPTTTHNSLRGNFVGTNALGTGPLRNDGHGVFLDNRSSGNLVGDDDTPGDDAPGGNTIAYNGGHGVVVVNGTVNPVRRNSIFGNVRRGIDLGNDSFTQNDWGDADTGANELQDYPVVTRVRFAPAGKTIEWTLNSTPDTRFTIDFFANTEPDPSGFGEGRRYLRTVTVTTNAEGNVIFNEAFAATDLFVSATATDPAGNTSEFSTVDTDGDALPDGWETNGIDVNEDNTVDLVLNSDPRKKDLFVEVDAMVGYVPTQAMLNKVIASFGAAPNALVHNPDGSNGITLHTVIDDVTVADAAWGNPWTGFDPVKSTYFGTAADRNHPTNRANLLGAKRLAYRYSVFAKEHSGDDSSGYGELPAFNRSAEPHGRNDFMVTLGHALWTGLVTSDIQAGTFMHELGHTLGLGHGGNSDVNHKPNYHSIMSYTWQFPSILRAGATARQRAYHNSWTLDYSRQMWPELDENDLDETQGIRGHAGHVLPGPWGGYIAEAGPVDWSGGDDDLDGNRRNDTHVMADVNGDGAFGLLTSFEDWSQLRFYFRESPAFTDGAHGASPAQEITARDYVSLAIPDGPSAARLVFYNNSSFDGNDPLADARDDGAIDATKAALFAGETPSFDNVSTCARGINGLMIDLALPAGAALTATDFTLEVGGAGAWAPLAAAPAVSVRPGAGFSGTDRVTLVLPDGAVRNTWLRVTVRATPNTGL
ncbi:MAG TPA: right-handed parallel beta-helix repeat-containing protein, partial [Tepidisphaeraceae bacterium]|nr:right-handed parallel beta-helix repeat-containing protein [Tepidisphaeraceae bacterium]